MKKEAIPAMVYAIQASVAEALRLHMPEPDTGTCNLDSPVLLLGRATPALKRALDPFGSFSMGGRFTLYLGPVGQADRRRRMAETCVAELTRRLPEGPRAVMQYVKG